MRTVCVKAVAIMLVFSLMPLLMAPVARAQDAAAPPPALVTEDPSQSTASGAGLQAASWVLTLPYGAAKVAFAILGGVTGGLTWLFSGGNDQAAKSVWVTSVYGTYVITPEHLNGDKAVRFLGVSSEPDNVAVETRSAR